MTEATEVHYYRFNLDDAPEHLHHTIKNSLTKKVFRYNNVCEGDGIDGMAGLVIEDDPDDEDDSDDEQIRAEEVFKYLAGQTEARSSSDPDEYPDTYKTPESFDVLISMVSA